MGDLKLFHVENGKAVELPGMALALEKPLQLLIEHNMEVLFGVRLVAREHSTGKKHGGPTRDSSTSTQRWATRTLKPRAPAWC